MKRIYLEVKVVAANEVRNVAFAKGINRTINLGNVEKILAMMKVKGYRKAEAIQVIRTEGIIKTGDITLVDINGKNISPEDASNYFLILDGQHRTIASTLYNEWAIENDKEVINVPAIEVELQEGETIAEYINEINITKKEWATPDYVQGAANINPNNEFLQRYNELIKSEKNSDGYSISTLNLIFCGTNNAISKSDFSQLCSGRTKKGKKAEKLIVPVHNMEAGNKFIQICKEKGFEDKDIAKRYLPTQFNNIKTKAGNVSEAFKIFQSITPNDKVAMFNSHGNLDESLVIEQFEAILGRGEKSSLVPISNDEREVTTNDSEGIPYLEAEEV